MKSCQLKVICLLVMMSIMVVGCTSIIGVNQPTAAMTAFLPATPTALPSQATFDSSTEEMVLSPTPPTQPLSLPPEDEASSRLTVPAGFAIRIFAQNLQGKPRFMSFGPDNALYISLTNGGAIMRLPDDNHDGLADSTDIVISGLNLPHGLEWRGDWLYVAENDRVERFRSSSGNGVFDQHELVTDNLPSGGGHFTRTLHFGLDGMLYVSAGSSCNVCEESDPRRAAILRFNPDGSIPADNPFASDSDPRKQAVWVWGLRNSVDFLWTPNGEMWANLNGRDNLIDSNGLPDNLPPEVIVFPIKSGQFYGWPYCYNPVTGFNTESSPQITDPQSGLSLPEGLDCSQAISALFSAPAHSAPLGMTLGQTGNFPPVYQSDLYVAYHGSWNVQNQADIRDCKVERLILENGRPVSSETFVNGWRALDRSCGSGAYGRPADVIFGPDGAMYISDDAGGRVYRVISIQ